MTLFATFNSTINLVIQRLRSIGPRLKMLDYLLFKKLLIDLYIFFIIVSDTRNQESSYFCTISVITIEVVRSRMLTLKKCLKTLIDLT